MELHPDEKPSIPAESSSETEISNGEANRSEDRIAVRDLLIWFGGSLVGGAAGFQIGAWMEANLIRLTAGVVGWVVGGIGAIFVASRLIRQPASATIPVRVASIMVIGFLAGCLVGSMAAAAFPGFEGLGTLLGGIVGFAAGWFVAPRFSQAG